MSTFVVFLGRTSLINMISNITGAEKLSDDADEKMTDDEDNTEVLVTVENLVLSSIVQPKKGTEERRFQ